MNNIKNKTIVFLKNPYIRYGIFLIIGFSIALLIWGRPTTKVDFRSKYYNIGNINLNTTNNLACTTLSEAMVSSFNKELHSSIETNPNNSFSLGVDVANKKLSLITATAVSVGANKADEYDIISFQGDSITAVGYSGLSLVTVVLNLKEGTVIVSKAGELLGAFGATWFGTCY